jgi:hypothetical protein
MAGWFIRHSIALSAVISDIGDDLTNLISPRTAEVLASVGPNERYGGWLGHMRRLLKRPRRDVEGT